MTAHVLKVVAPSSLFAGLVVDDPAATEHIEHIGS
jgi:hypothetical protein